MNGIGRTDGHPSARAQCWGFSVTILTVGSLSDHFGLRPMLIASLLVAATGTATCALAAGRNNIRERITLSRWRLRFKIGDPAIVTTTAIGLIALPLVVAAPASATDSHGTHRRAKHVAISAVREPNERAGGSSELSRHDGVDNVGKVPAGPSVGEPTTVAERDIVNPGASEIWLPGHDKCKRRRGLRSLPLWCTDPAAGWIGSPTSRAQNNPANPIGICDAGSLHPESRRRPVPQPLQ